MKHLANGITLIRIILAPLLLVMKPLGTAYLLIYIICGLSDMLDGYVARKTDTTSKMGSKLDSIADFVMMVIVSITLYEVIEWTDFIIGWVLMIGFIRIVSLVTVLLKFKELAMLHTYSNKLAGFMLFIAPLLMGMMRYQMVVIITVCVIASFSALEELLIHITSKELELDRKYLFKVLK